jgi:cbb3-type cytochrome oxidase maturation protein
MTVLFVVLPLAVLLSGLAALAFVWATRRGQFDDLETPALRLLTDELEERRASEVSPPPRVSRNHPR